MQNLARCLDSAGIQSIPVEALFRVFIASNEKPNRRAMTTTAKSKYLLGSGRCLSERLLNHVSRRSPAAQLQPDVLAPFRYEDIRTSLP
ncbi:hypothetical protein ASPTUDRAFT_42226 [Aspergillus tubingensis CBS 134.48]|uniref:Uncharacterized protein n=1 Tax=Aspergillus tubingensis (strain CBS 134.48) TaxID=767770 RepID=A0A1L9N9Q7_ASPTC|nr:hypothetical protein ASPTUDRAFT_42226 [Aspergillus tubingensis CBS 134.48]